MPTAVNTRHYGAFAKRALFKASKGHIYDFSLDWKCAKVYTSVRLVEREDSTFNDNLEWPELYLYVRSSGVADVLADRD